MYCVIRELLKNTKISYYIYAAPSIGTHVVCSNAPSKKTINVLSQREYTCATLDAMLFLARETNFRFKRISNRCIELKLIL